MAAALVDRQRPVRPALRDCHTPSSYSALMEPTPYLAPALRPAPVVFWRRRLVALLLAVASTTVAVHLLARLGDAPLAFTEPVPAAGSTEQVYVVQPGDTLWSIASAAQPEGDPRPLVDRLSAQLDGPLTPGDRLTLR